MIPGVFGEPSSFSSLSGEAELSPCLVSLCGVTGLEEFEDLVGLSWLCSALSSKFWMSWPLSSVLRPASALRGATYK